MKHCRKEAKSPLVPPTPLSKMDSPFIEAIDLFNSAHFFAAHEVLEEVWRLAPVPEKKFWQGLIQTAVAFHHRSAGNRIGAQSLLDRAIRNLAAYPARYGGIELSPLKESLELWQAAISKNETDFPLPIIQLAVDSQP